MSGITGSPPRAPPIKYNAPLGTRWAKEKAAAGGSGAFDLPTDPKSIGPWILGECVGKGASGRVKIAKHRRTGQLAAVKILPIAPLVNSRNSLSTQQGKPDRHRLGVDREITMMKLMNHPNIMRIYDVFEGEKELFLVLEYVEGGELFDFLVNRGRLPPQEALEYFKQIIYGLNYAHTFSIIHRDLKPENILIASLSPPIIKIADWGMAAFAPPTLQLETSCGSPHYASPEIVNGEKYQGNATDIWSCGVILYALLTGRLPFDDKNVRTLLSKVKSGKYEMPAWIDPMAKDLISRMLVVDVAKRISIPEILAHPWLTTPPSVALQTKGQFLRPMAPPLPPSPSILARPIASPSFIDPELFSSLRIIWGRHADPDGELIRRDLCSPAGFGVHTKAFYYLLNKYREESNRKRLGDGEDTDKTLAVNGVSRLRFDQGWRDAKASTLGGRLQDALSCVPPSTPSRATTIPSPVQAPNVVRRKTTELPSPMDHIGNRSISRERPASPFGPRPLPSPHQVPCKVAEHHAHCGPESHPVQATLTRVPDIGPRSHPTRRGYTFSHPTDKQIQFEAKSVDARVTVHSLEERRRNTILSTGPNERRRTNAGDTRIPSPIHHGSPTPVASRNCGQSADGRRISPPALRSPRSPRVPTRCQSEGGTLGVVVDGASADTDNVSTPVLSDRSALINSNMLDGTSHSPAKIVRTINTTPGAHMPGHLKADVAKKPLNISRSAGQGDKENQRSCSNPMPSTRRASGIGLGMSVNNARDPYEEMGNVVCIGMGNTPVSGSKKERKSKPPALELPARRPTITALDSPIALPSPAASPHNAGSSARMLTSPVVGEFKGWFSSLFSWKVGGHNSTSGANGNGVVYSPDDSLQTCRDVANLLESLGVIVVLDSPSGSNTAANGDLSTMARLKCRVEELSVDVQANISLKPVRFRVELTPMQQPKPLARQSLWSPPLSPIADNECFFLPPPAQEDDSVHSKGVHAVLPFPSVPNPGLTPRVRMSMLPVIQRAASSGQNTPIPSPGLNEGRVRPANSIGSGSDDVRIPHGSLCGILLVYEKGSTSSFKTIWKKVKEYYCDSPTKARALQTPDGLCAFSPLMASTPVSQACPLGPSITNSY